MNEERVRMVRATFERIFDHIGESFMSILARGRAKTLVGAAVVVGAAGLLYSLTAARDIVVGDTPELITAAVTLGVAHPPGYPLFTMLGHVFSLLPFGPIPFRLNLLAATCDALTVGVVYFTAVRLTRSRVAAAVAALVLAVNPIFWAWSLASEVFPLNNLLAALLICFLVIWYQQPERGTVLLAAFFVAGLALANHQTIVLLMPAFCFVLWKRHALLRTRPGLLAICIGTFLIGLLPYMYVPLASAHHPVYNWGNVSSLRDLVALITRRDYGTGRLVSAAGYTGGSPTARIVALIMSFGPVAGTLALLGAIAVHRRERWYFWFTVIAFVCVGPLFVAITNLNLAMAPSALFVLQRFFLLSQVVLAPWFAFGVLTIAKVIARYAPAWPLLPLRLTAAACLIAVIAIVLTNYRGVDQSRNVIARHLGEDIFATTEPGSILLATGDAIAFPLLYLHNVEGVGQGTTLVVLPFLSFEWYVRQLQGRHPELIIPFDHYDGRSNNLKMFVDANSRRTICITGTTGIDDRSLDGSYWPYQRGLLIVVEPLAKNFALQDMLNENEQLLNRYRPPAYQAIRPNSFEADILTLYAWPAFRIGTDCEHSGLKREAQIWYRRALGINPHFSRAREALTRLEH